MLARSFINAFKNGKQHSPFHVSVKHGKSCVAKYNRKCFSTDVSDYVSHKKIDLNIECRGEV